MKTTPLTALVHLPKNVLAGLFCLVALTALAAPPKTNTPPVPTVPQGYLPKAGPAGLRFAPPAKPRPAYLPPLPITPDPQPTAVSEPAPGSAGNSVTTHVTGQTSPRKAPAATDAVNANQGNRAKTAGSPAESGLVTPQMLLKFFPNGKPAGYEMLLNDPVSFQVPVRETRPSSSASYEVK